MTKEQLKEDIYNMPSIEKDGHHWIRMVDHIALVSQATKEAKEANKKIIKNYIKAMMKFELGQNARIAPGETEYNKALFNILDFLNKDN